MPTLRAPTPTAAPSLAGPEPVLRPSFASSGKSSLPPLKVGGGEQGGGGGIGFGDLLKGALPGLVQFGQGIARVAYGGARVPYDIADTALGGRLPGTPLFAETDWSGDWASDVASSVRSQYGNLLPDMASSVKRTANVTGIGDDENIIRRYQDAVREGRWMGELVEDVGNVALIAGGVSSVAGRVGRAAMAPSNVSRVLGEADTAAARSLSAAAEGGRVARITPRAASGRELSLPSELRVSSRVAGEGAEEAARLRPKVATFDRRATSPGSEFNVVTTGGRGLAGAFERAGAQGAANMADAVGRAAARVSLGADLVDPSTHLIIGAQKIASGEATNLLARGASRVLRRVMPEKAARFADWVETRELGHAGREAIQRIQTDATRATVQAFRDLDTGLNKLVPDPELRRAYGFAWLADQDQAFVDLARVTDEARARGMADADIQAIVTETMGEVPQDFIPRVGDLDVYNRVKARDVPDEVLALLDATGERLRRHVAEKTAMELQQGLIKPEDLAEVRRGSDGTAWSDLSLGEQAQALTDGDIAAPEMKPSTVSTLRGVLEDRAARMDPQVDRQARLVGRLERRAAVREALTAQLPQPGRMIPESATLDSRLADLERKTADYDAKRAELADQVAKLDEITDEMGEALGDTPQAVIDDLEADIADRVEVLEQVRADVEAAVREGATAEQVLSEAELTPKPDVRSEAVGDAETLRTLAEEVRREAHDALRAELEQWTATGRPAMASYAYRADGGRRAGADAKRRQALGGEHDALRSDSPVWNVARRQKKWYNLSGWFVRDGMAPDVWLDSVRRNVGGLENVSDLDIFEQYIAKVDRLYDLRRRPVDIDEVVTSTAERAGVDPDMVDLALRDKRGFAAAKVEEITRAANEVRDEFLALPDEERTMLVDSVDAMQRAGDDPSSIADAILDALEYEFEGRLGAYDTRRLLTALFEGFEQTDVVRWLIDETEIPMQAIRRADDAKLMAESTVDAIQRDIDRMRAEKEGIETRLLPAIEGVARAEESLADIVRDVQVADVETRFGVEGERAPWQRRQGEGQAQGVTRRDVAGEGGGRAAPTPSGAEREIAAAARASERARIERMKLANLEAQRNRWREKARGLEDELGRSLQNRIRGQDRGTITSMQNGARRFISSDRLGRLEYNGPNDARLTGLVGKLSEQYGIADDVIDAVERMRDDVKAQIADMEDGIIPDDAEVPTTKSMVKDAFEGIMAERGLDASEAWQRDRGRWEAAVLADDLIDTLDAYKPDMDEGSLMSVWAAVDEVRERIKTLDENLSKQAAADFENYVSSTFNSYLNRRHRMLDNVNSQYMAAMPKRFRTPAQNAQRTVRGLLRLAEEAANKGEWAKATAFERYANDSPTTMAALVRQGVRDPLYLAGGAAPGTGGRRAARRAGREFRQDRVSVSRQSKTGLREVTMENYARREAAVVNEIVNNAGVQHILDKFGESLRDVAGSEIRELQMQRRGQLIPWSEVERILDEKGYAVVRRAEEKVPKLAGERTLPEVTRTDAGGVDFAGQIALDENMPAVFEASQMDDITVMPKKLKVELEDVTNPQSGKFWQSYDQVMQLWKTPTLAWSPSWLVNNLIGNAVMATVQAGMSPAKLAQYIRRMTEAERSATGARSGMLSLFTDEGLSMFMEPRLASHGLMRSERMIAHQLADPNTRLGRAVEYINDPNRSAVGRASSGMYAVNEFTDNLFRTAVYLDRLERYMPEIPRRLLDDDGLVRLDLTDAERAEVGRLEVEASAAKDKAVSAALNIMGDFTRLTRFERRVVKRALPFYPWLRHQTSIALRLPINSPQRWAWMAALADVIGDEDDRSFVGQVLGGVMMTPWGTTSLQASMPYPEGLTSFADAPENWIATKQGAGRALSPLAKLPLEVGFGWDMGQVTAGSRSPKEEPIGDFGQRESTSAAERFFRGDFAGAAQEALYRTTGQQPQLRGLRDIALGAMDPRPRTDAGEVIPFADPRPGGLLPQVARTARLPFTPIDIERQLEVAERRDRRARLGRRPD